MLSLDAYIKVRDAAKDTLSPEFIVKSASDESLVEWLNSPDKGRYPDWFKEFVRLELAYREGTDTTTLSNVDSPTGGSERVDRPKQRKDSARYSDNDSGQTGEASKKASTSRAGTKEESCGESLPQQIYLALFATDRYCTIGNTVYRFNGTHYERVEDGVLHRQIAQYLCEAHPSKEKASIVAAAHNWLKALTYVSSSEVNVGGLNLANGILKVAIIGGKVQHSLEPHTPDKIFTYCSNVEYNPEASDYHLNKVLEALDEPYRSMWLKTISSSLAIEEVRKRHGRQGVRALIQTGKGSNGKDTLVLPLEMILSESFTMVSTAQMYAHDQGRHFGTTALAHSIINHSNEATAITKVFSCALAKRVITGNPIEIEEKHEKAYSIRPHTTLIFSTNEDIWCAANNEAVDTRFVIIPYEKTFKDRPTKANELKANPRYANDLPFVAKEIAPALINRLLIELQDVIDNGINYDASVERLDRVRYDNDPIYQAMTDKGFVEDPDGDTPLELLWERFTDYLIEEGIVDAVEDIRRLDSKRYPKDRGAFSTRLAKSFPGITRHRPTQPNGKKQTCIKGITWKSQNSLSSLSDNGKSSVSACPEGCPEAVQRVSEACPENIGGVSTESDQTTYGQPQTGIRQALDRQLDNLKPLQDKQTGKKAENQPKRNLMQELLSKPVAYRPGQQVRLLGDGKVYEIADCTHAHVQLVGRKYAVNLDDIEPVAESSGTLQPGDRFRLQDTKQAARLREKYEGVSLIVEEIYGSDVVYAVGIDEGFPLKLVEKV